MNETHRSNLTVHGKSFLKTLQEKGFEVPPMTRRIIIDIPFNDVVKVVTETCADSSTIDIVGDLFMKFAQPLD